MTGITKCPYPDSSEKNKLNIENVVELAEKEYQLVKITMRNLFLWPMVHSTKEVCNSHHLPKTY